MYIRVIFVRLTIPVYITANREMLLPLRAWVQRTTWRRYFGMSVITPSCMGATLANADSALAEPYYPFVHGCNAHNPKIPPLVLLSNPMAGFGLTGIPLVFMSGRGLLTARSGGLPIPAQ